MALSAAPVLQKRDDEGQKTESLPSEGVGTRLGQKPGMNTSNTALFSLPRIAAAALTVCALGAAASAMAKTEAPAGPQWQATMEREAPAVSNDEASAALPRQWRWERQAVSFDSMYRR